MVSPLVAEWQLHQTLHVHHVIHFRQVTIIA